jgi:hypothetical protein
MRILGDSTDDTIGYIGVKIGAIDAGVQALEVQDRNSPGTCKALARCPAIRSHGELTVDTATYVSRPCVDSAWDESNCKYECKMHRSGSAGMYYNRMIQKEESARKSGILPMKDGIDNSNS